MSEVTSEVMFNNCWYDSWNNAIHLWWTIDGKRRYDKYDYEHEYWVKTDTPSKITDMFGNYMEKKVCPTKWDVPKHLNWSDRAESDIQEEIKFLHKHFSTIELSPKISNVQVCYFDIEIATENGIFPKPELASYPVNAIAAYFSKENSLYVMCTQEFKYVYEYTIDADGNKVPKTYGTLDQLKQRLYQETGVRLDDIIINVFADELAMLESFVSLVHKRKTDIISGWYSKGFDVPYIINRLENLGSKKSLSPIKKIKNSKKDKLAYDIAGLSHIDYQELYRDKFTFDNKGYYSLDNISNIELNKSKLAYDGSLEDFYKKDWNGFILYNCIDTLLVKALDDKKGFMNLALMSAHQSKIPIERVIGTLTGLTGLAIDYLHKQDLVLSDREPINTREKFPGGVSWCMTGLHKYCVSFDITSMYPHLMVSYNNGIETLEIWKEEDLKDIIRIDNMETKKTYFFNPTDIVKVGREVNGNLAVLEVEAKNIKDTDMVVVEPHQYPDWGYNMAIQTDWK